MVHLTLLNGSKPWYTHGHGGLEQYSVSLKQIANYRRVRYSYKPPIYTGNESTHYHLTPIGGVVRIVHWRTYIELNLIEYTFYLILHFYML